MHLIEPLEARIAPAAVFTYTDVDGDRVTVTTSKGTSPELAAIIYLRAEGLGAFIEVMEFSDAATTFDGTDLTLSAKPVNGKGNGLADVRFIDATGTDGDGASLNFGTVRIAGDLRFIEAGKSAATTGVRSLAVQSLSAAGIASVITGSLGALKVAHDMLGAEVVVEGKLGSVAIGGSLAASPAGMGGLIQAAQIGNVTIAGDVRGGALPGTGVVHSTGAMGNVKIGGSLVGSGGKLSGAILAASLGNVTLGDSLEGGSGQFSGSINAATAGNITIAHDLKGGTAPSSGSILIATKAGNITIGRDLIGGSSNRTGFIDAERMGNLTIGRDLLGGAGSESGSAGGGVVGNVKIGRSVIGGGGNSSGGIALGNAVSSVTIGGDLEGGSGFFSGFVSLAGVESKAGAVTVRGDLRGGSIDGADSLSFSGFIQSNGHIASVTIGKSLIAGTDDSTGALKVSGAIWAGSLGTVKIGGGIEGTAENPAQIMTKGLAVKPTKGQDLAIGSVAVTGDVRFAEILAGFGTLASAGGLVEVPANADASIGTVTVGGDWVASSLVAGAEDKGAPGYGDGEVRQSVGNTALIARIASVTIKGFILGTEVDGDVFGFVAEHLVKFRAFDGQSIPLKPGPSNDNLATGFTFDIGFLEVFVAPV